MRNPLLIGRTAVPRADAALHRPGSGYRQPFGGEAGLPRMSIMQSAGCSFIIGQSQLATSFCVSLTQTRTCDGAFDLLGPKVGRDCHSQWPGPRSCAEAAETDVNAASAAARVRIVFMSKILG